MAPLPARVVDSELQRGEEFTPIVVGSEAWFAWLRKARSFRYAHNSVAITARKEQRASRDYWYAYVRRAGRLRRAYFGKSRRLTPFQLAHVAGRLIEANQPQSRSVLLGITLDNELNLLRVREALQAIEERVCAQQRPSQRDVRQVLAIAEELLAALSREREQGAREWRDLQRYLHEVRAGVQQAPQLRSSSRGSNEVF